MLYRLLASVATTIFGKILRADPFNTRQCMRLVPGKIPLPLVNNHTIPKLNRVFVPKTVIEQLIFSQTSHTLKEGISTELVSSKTLNGWVETSLVRLNKDKKPLYI